MAAVSVIVTILPPARRTPRERSKTSPPITSKTTSTWSMPSSSVGLQVHEHVRSELDHRVSILGAAGADDPGAGLASELHGDGADAAGRAVDQDGLPGLEVIRDRTVPATT